MTGGRRGALRCDRSGAVKGGGGSVGAGRGGLLVEVMRESTAAEEGGSLAGFVLAGVAGERTVGGVRRKGTGGW